MACGLMALEDASGLTRGTFSSVLNAASPTRPRRDPPDQVLVAKEHTGQLAVYHRST